jgi:hypothetical protein
VSNVVLQIVVLFIGWIWLKFERRINSSTLTQIVRVRTFFQKMIRFFCLEEKWRQVSVWAEKSVALDKSRIGRIGGMGPIFV